MFPKLYYSNEKNKLKGIRRNENVEESFKFASHHAYMHKNNLNEKGIFFSKRNMFIGP